ncbi:MAG: TonB-dependent receptor [Bacteroidales bacterium]|nr:TonB-dependent receptor [Bacteroidales bacterium]
MKKLALIILVICLSTYVFFGQKQIRISGYVKDSLTGEALIGANIIETNTNKGTSTNLSGFFSLEVNDSSEIQISFIGYSPKTIHAKDAKNQITNILLIAGTQLDEVVVSANNRFDFNNTGFSKAEIMQIPSIGGKPDVAKSLQFLPGISQPTEGSSLMNVRGGEPGQNLYIFDNVPIIHVNHLGGLFSVFNPDIINGIEVYKGGFPAKYGGRLSSIVNITQKDGDFSMLKSSFSIGLTDAGLSIEGPMKLKNSSFIITARKTMTEALLGTFTRLSASNDFVYMYGFHDVNAKFCWKPDLKNSFTLNLYQGDDYLLFWVDMYETKAHNATLWGNWLSSLKWNRVISPRLFKTTTLSYTRYRLKNQFEYVSIYDIDTMRNNGKTISLVEDFSLRSGFQYSINNDWQLDYGVNLSLLHNKPADYHLEGYTNIDISQNIYSTENSIYLENKLKLWNRFYSNLGVRAILYTNGSFNQGAIEPRVNLTYNIGKNSSINLTYMKVNQFSHLIFSKGTINNELWIPSDNDIKPSISNQYTAGWQLISQNKMFQAEIGVFYKDFTNLSMFKEGYENFAGIEDWKSLIETGGSGEAKGLEFMIKKNAGRLKAFASYTLSRSTRQYDNINYGNEFLFNYDRLHSFAFHTSYDLSEKVSLSLNWVFQSGLPYTPIIGRYNVPDTQNPGELTEVLIFGDRNSERASAYHRLDLGLTYRKSTKKRGLPAEWNFVIYNAYNRYNAYNYFYKYRYDYEFSDTYPYELLEWTRKLGLYKISYLPIIPSFSYKVYFNEYSLKNFKKIKIKKEKERFEQTYIRKRYDIKIGYAMPNVGFYVRNRWWLPQFPHMFSIEGNYGFSKFVTGGLFLSFSSFDYIQARFNENTQSYEGYEEHLNLLTYSTKFNFHLMPIIRKQKNSRFDLYITAKTGAYYFKKLRFDYNAGLGLAIYPGKHWGFYGEYTYGDLNANNLNWKVGIVICFHKTKQ